MEVYKTEDEQIEAIKKWWQENGKAIVFGVVIGLSAIFGWRSWQTHIIQQTEAASGLYQQLVSAVREEKFDQGKTTANKIISDYDNTEHDGFTVFLPPFFNGFNLFFFCFVDFQQISPGWQIKA